MDATVKKPGLLRRLQMPGANTERMTDALDKAEITARGKEPGWDIERKKRKKKLMEADATDSVGA